MSAVKNSNVPNPPSSKKRGGGFLRQAKSRKDHPADLEPITEEELAKKDSISPEDVLRLQKITEGKGVRVLRGERRSKVRTAARLNVVPLQRAVAPC